MNISGEGGSSTRRDEDDAADRSSLLFRSATMPTQIEVGSVHIWENTETGDVYFVGKKKDGTVVRIGPLTEATSLGGGSGGTAPVAAEYVTMSANGTLTQERILAGGLGISIADGGAGANVTVAIDTADDMEITGFWTFSSYIYMDSSGNKIQLHSDGAGNLVIERSGAAGTLALGNSGNDLDTTVYGDLSVSKALTVGDDITGTGGTTINGGTAASNGLALESTTNGTKGGIFLASGTSAPVYTHGASSPYADMVIGSSLALKRTAISSNTTLGITHGIVEVDCTGGNVTVTLPSASGKDGRVYFIRRIDNSGNTLTIAAASGSVNQLGAAAGSYTVAARQQTKLYADGTSAWYEF